jgi:class 3 adenylate cyclase/predicted ATPase
MASEASPATDSRAYERRQLTVMFCDMVGSTALSDAVELEDLQEVIQAFQNTCGRVVERFGGQIAQVLGDGLLVYFGYPEAHENDPERAVTAALHILEEIEPVAKQMASQIAYLNEHRLRMRIGINTGEVMIGRVGSGSARTRLALGETVNVTARIEASAEPSTILISDASLRLVEGLFDLEPRGEIELRGVAEPVPVYRVLRGKGPKSRMDLVAARGFTPLVGREPELAALMERWERVRSGLGQVVVMGGEPGVGKSRLVHDLREHIGDGAYHWLELRGSAYHKRSAFHPLAGVIDALIEERRGVAPEDGAEESRLTRLESILRQASMPLPETVPLFADLADIEHEYAPLALSHKARRRRTLEAFAGWLFGFADPVVLVAEDLHWFDPSTLELLDRLVEGCSGASVLLIGTHRPEFTPPWQSSDSLLRQTLRPLSLAESELMVQSVAGDRLLSHEVVREVVERADGVPLFVEELCKAVLESHATGHVAVPATLRDSLMGRLDRLGEAKDIAQLASIIGREQSRDLLGRVSPLDPAILDQVLAQLVHADVLRHRGTGSDLVYSFRHALIGDVAYESLVRDSRRELHARVGQALEDHSPERVATEPEVVARHWEEANRPWNAVHHYRAAGWRAIQRSAHPEAIAHLEHGIGLLSRVDKGRDRDRLELQFRTALGAALVASRGYGSEDVEWTHLRIRELCRDMGEGHELAIAITGLYLYYSARAEFKEASNLGAQMIELGESTGDCFLISWGHHFSGMSRFYEGAFAAALAHFERAMELRDPGNLYPGWSPHEHDVAAVGGSYAAMTLSVMGHADEAQRAIASSIDIGRESLHPINHALALAFATLAHHVQGEHEQVLQRANAAIHVAEDQAFPVYQGMGMMMRGWALARGGGGQEALDLLDRGMAHTVTTGTRTEGPRALGLLAEAQSAAGRPAVALETVLGAQQFARSKNSPYWEAELLRLEGELRCQLGGGDDARTEPCFLAAIACAQKQEAGALELRAATSLARYLHQRGRDADARRHLRVACNRAPRAGTPQHASAMELLAAL